MVILGKGDYMLDYNSLLMNEYIPGELPPCFGSKDLADNSIRVLNLIKAVGRDYSIPLKFSGYKSESSRRTFAVPNPYHYCKAVQVIIENIGELEPIFSSSPYSLSAPKKGKAKIGQAYFKRSNSVSESKAEIEKCFQNNKYEIRLDINSFFDSVYTHSIPWAIHGIPISKSRRNDDTLLGNKIDKAMRALNYDQTNGILIGNALSRIISEIILCSIDKEISKEFGDIKCCRYVDDYYIFTKDSTQIQQIIAFIRNKLAVFELRFNESKIQIIESPFIYGKPWVENIKQYMNFSPDIFLTRLVSEYKHYKDISIFKYGLKILQFFDFSNDDWSAMQSRLINLLVSFPSLSDLIIKIFLRNKDRIKTTSLKAALYSIIDECILLKKEQELVWAIWFLKVFSLKISQDYTVKVLRSKNDLAMIILLSIISEKERKKNPKIVACIKELRSELKDAETDDRGNYNSVMWSSRWLLAYEANRNKWLNLPDDPLEYAKKNAFFNELLNLKIKFFDCDYTYSLTEEPTVKYEYATRNELYQSVNMLKKLIKMASDTTSNKSGHEESSDDIKRSDTIERIIALVEKDSAGYI